MEIKKIELPELIDDGWQNQPDWQIMEMLNRIADGLNALLAEIPPCTCPDDNMKKVLTQSVIESGEYGAHGWCEKHGRWEVLNDRWKR